MNILARTFKLNYTTYFSPSSNKALLFHSKFHVGTFSIRFFGSSLADSENGVGDDREFKKWSNGGGLFHESACIDSTAVVEVGAVIHPGAVLGADVHVGSGTIVGPRVTIGHSTRLGYNVALANCFVGDSCIIHNGVCVGQDGFGFLIDEHGNMTKKPQHSLKVSIRGMQIFMCDGLKGKRKTVKDKAKQSKKLYARIGNHVEIGANTCVDRGSWRDTIIGDHTKIDNLVQIAHNVTIGKCCMLCGQVGIAGSAMIGDYVTLGGRVAVRDHVSIVSKVRLAANSTVTKDIKKPGDYGGFPAVPIQVWRRQVAAQSWNYKKDVKNG